MFVPPLSPSFAAQNRAPVCPQCEAGPRPRAGPDMWEINRVGLLSQRVCWTPLSPVWPNLPASLLLRRAVAAGRLSTSRLHYACQMGWELDSNSHRGREGGGEREREMERGGRWRRKREEGNKREEGEGNGFCFHWRCKLLHFNVTPLGPGGIKCLFLNNRR